MNQCFKRSLTDNMFGKKLYVHNSQSHSVCGSNVFIASYLHALLFGRPEQDDYSQEFFGAYSLTFFQKSFVELTQTLLQAKEKLEELEELGDNEYPEDDFFKGIRYIFGP